ncbi:MAG: hypothetical protein L0241_06850 [Planctomycetia bacterium]|nr:hypothetical protein [Planctomycetia bacterium]
MPLGLGRKIAEQEAREAALQHLAQFFAHWVEPMPCPACGCYQPDMCRALTDKKYGWMNFVGATLLTFACMFGVWVFQEDFDPKQAWGRGGEGWATMWAVLTVVCFVLGTGVLLGRRYVRKTHDPNETIPHEIRMAEAQQHAMLLAEFQAKYPTAETFHFPSS